LSEEGGREGELLVEGRAVGEFRLIECALPVQRPAAGLGEGGREGEREAWVSHGFGERRGGREDETEGGGEGVREGGRECDVPGG